MKTVNIPSFKQFINENNETYDDPGLIWLGDSNIEETYSKNVENAKAIGVQPISDKILFNDDYIGVDLSSDATPIVALDKARVIVGEYEKKIIDGINKALVNAGYYIPLYHNYAANTETFYKKDVHDQDILCKVVIIGQEKQISMLEVYGALMYAEKEKIKSHLGNISIKHRGTIKRFDNPIDAAVNASKLSKHKNNYVAHNDLKKDLWIYDRFKVLPK